MPRPWVFPIALEPDSSAGPMFLQIARAVSADVRRGRLRPGAVLPGSRTLARTLGVHRNTVLAGYRELQAEGWVVVAERSLRVSSELPPHASRSNGSGPLGQALGFDLRTPRFGPGFPPEPPSGLVFGAGLPDTRMLPTDALARAYRRALRTKGSRPLSYGDPRGDLALRQALAGLLAETRGLACDESRLLVTSGSQMAIDLIARTLLAPGDIVAVEDPGYRPAWEALRLAGAELVPVPVDDGGLRVDVLETLCAKRALRAVYLTPHHQFPTTVTMSPARRMRLLVLARTRRVALIEDDYDFEFHYAGRPVLPLASASDAGVVVYIGTLSKVLAPGLRLGFLAGPPPLIDAVAARRAFLDRQGDQVLERAVGELIEDGLLQRHARKMRRVYEARRDVLAKTLERELRAVVSFAIPSGGMSLWLAVDTATDVAAWSERALEKGVSFYPGACFDFRARNRPFIRLGFSRLNEGELREAVRRMKAALSMP